MTISEAIIVFNADTLVGEAVIREMLEPQHRQHLSQQFGHVYATVRDVTHSGDLPALGLCLVEMGDNPDERKLVDCLKQCKINTVVLVPDWASKQMVQQSKKIINAAKQAGIERFVLMSRMGVSDVSTETSKQFCEIETAFKQSGISTAAIVRSGLFIQSVFWFRRALHARKLQWPIKEDVKFSLVSLRDVANFIVYELLHGERMTTTTKTGEPHLFKLTGPNLHTIRDLLSLFERTIGSKIEYHMIDRKEFERCLREKEGLPEIVVRDIADAFDLINKGCLSTISDDQKKATGKEPIRFEEWLNKHKTLFESRTISTTFTRF